MREYDIRGPVGERLTEADAYAVGRSFATLIRRAGGRKLVVGRDGRISSPGFAAALMTGATDAGIAVVDIGLGPTPMLNFAEQALDDVHGGIQITGSHNPAHHNGFKLVMQHRPFFGPDIQALGAMAAAGDWDSGAGHVTRVDIMGCYIDRLLQGLPADIPALRIAWDAGNGAAGPAIDHLTKRMPGEHHLLFTNVDGHFPNHHPDPTIEANLVDLRRVVAANNLDFGVAFDGDGDRIGVIDGQGRVIWADQLLQIFAEDILRTTPGAAIMGDIKCSQQLFDHVAALGGQPIIWKSGHSWMKSGMVQTGALLGGEMSGHIFFADDWPGFDDAIYAAVRLVRAVASLGHSVTDLFDAIPATISTPELRFTVDEARKFAIVDDVLARLQAEGANVNTLDGARVATADGWWLLRASNTQAMLVARAESSSEAGLTRLIATIDTHLAACGVSRN